MFQKVLEEIQKEFSGKNAKELIEGISNFHRIQSSPGFREAANYCHNKAKEYSISSVVTHEYPAKGHNKYWGNPVPKEWSIKSATLELIEPKSSTKFLCRFFENPCSVIQRSKSTGKDGVIAEVVILPKGLSEEEMKKHNIEGKFILTDDPDLKKLRLVAVGKLGAAGIIYDLVSELPPIRTRSNFPTARRYTSFWYGTQGDEGDAFGFVLSAEQGNELRSLIKKMSKDKKKIKLQAKIEAEFYEGKMEVVDFTIPGLNQDQEVLAVAHLCHPKPGAIDNASGCGTLIEVARTLEKLIQTGKLRQPRRSIRFLLMAEFTGTFCYLASNEKKIDNFIAGINLDMVGADPTAGGGRTLIMERSHNSNPSYVNEVLSAILEKTAQQVPNFLKTGASAMFQFANDQPFSGGSDHLVLGDPDIGIASPMFIQWPDRYYHTGEDSIEKVSAEMLQLVGTMTAAYCYFIANANLSDIRWVIREIASKGKERITKFSRKKTTEFLVKLDEENSKEKKAKLLANFYSRIKIDLNFRRDIEIKALQSTEKLALIDKEAQLIIPMIQEMEKAINQHTEEEITQTEFCVREIAVSLGVKLKAQAEQEESEEVKEIKQKIPHRIYRGPITGLALGDLSIEDMKEANKINEEYKGMSAVFSSSLFWINGKRSLGEISELVHSDIGKTNLQYLHKMYKYYEKHGMLKLK